MNTNPDEIKSRIAELEQRFPSSEYIWLTPHRAIGGFIETVFSLSPEILEFNANPDAGDFYFVDQPMWECRGRGDSTYKRRAWPKPENAIRHIDAGAVAFTASSLQIIATAGGVNWMPNTREYGTGRVDDGSDSMVCEFAAGGTLIGLSGMKPVIKTCREDLNLERDVIIDNLMNDSMPEYEKTKKWPVDGEWIEWQSIPADRKIALAEKRADSGVLRLRRKMIEKCETKAQNRVIRHMFGIKSKYDPREIAGKKWLLLVMRFDPKPANESERHMLMSALTRTFISAYPGLPAGDVAIERIELRPADCVALPAGAAVIDSPDEPGIAFETFMAAAEITKLELIDKCGDIDGAGRYYAILNAHGYNHANEVRDPVVRGRIYDAFKTMHETINCKSVVHETGAVDSPPNPASSVGASNDDANVSHDRTTMPNGELFTESSDDAAPDSAPQPDDIWTGFPSLYNRDDPVMMFVAMRHDAFRRMSDIELVTTISESAAEYDITADPLGIRPLMDMQEHHGLVYAALKLFMNNTGKLNPPQTKKGSRKK